MRVLMTAGGTAGHVNPAIAIANIIKEYEKDSEIFFVSSSNPGDKALDLVPRAGYEKPLTVDICGRYQIWNPKNLKTLYLMIKSKSQARAIIEKIRPDVIIGTGGYACYPMLNAGADMGIPTLAHESNAATGKAIKKLQGKLDSIMTNFDSSANDLKKAKRVVNVGTPTTIGQKPVTALPENGFSKSVLSFGGSLGAETLNNAVVEMLKALADKYPDTEFYHAAGKRDYSHMQEVFAEQGLDDKKNVTLVDYIYDMDARMQRADLVISRAGALSLCELSLLGKTAILVPSPFVANNHQYYNAKTLYDAGACELVQESEFATGKLTKTVDELLANGERCRTMAEKIKCFGKPDAGKLIYEEIKRTVESKKKS